MSRKECALFISGCASIKSERYYNIKYQVRLAAVFLLHSCIVAGAGGCTVRALFAVQKGVAAYGAAVDEWYVYVYIEGEYQRWRLYTTRLVYY